MGYFVPVRDNQQRNLPAPNSIRGAGGGAMPHAPAQEPFEHLFDSSMARAMGLAIAYAQGHRH